MIGIKLLHINSYFVTNNLHGNLVKKLDEKGVSQVVYIPIVSDKLRNVNRIEGLNHAIYLYSRCFNMFTRLVWPFKMIQIWLDFSIKSKNFKIDIIHAHSLIANGLIAYLYHLKNGTPYVVSIRNTDFNLFLKKKYFFKWIGRKILKASSAITILSPSYRNIHLKNQLGIDFFNLVKDKIFLVPNGIDDFWLEGSGKKKIKTPLKILFVGRLDRNKNLETLIKACETITAEGLALDLDVVGQGILFNTLSSKSYSCNVKFHGHIEAKERLMQFYQSADIFAVPSFTESFGIVYAEALSQGLPVIYTKWQGFDGHFEDGEVGFSIDPYDSNDIANKIRSIISNYDTFTTNIMYHKNKFSWESSVKKLISIYNIHGNTIS